MNHNIDDIIQKISKVVAAHQLEKDGTYARWRWQNVEQNRELGINEYGCADAVNILYTIGEFPKDLKLRQSCINALQGLQNQETGLFVEKTHHPIHTTAHCIAALELFDAKPLYPIKELLQYANNTGIWNFLESLDWKNNPWNESHKGAGIFAALVLSDSVDKSWMDTYFEWLWENADPETGFWKKDMVNGGGAPKFHHLASSFHYLFNHEYVRRPLRYPEKVIDTCIDMYQADDMNGQFGRLIGFAEIDWVYCITRASRQTPHRFDECRRILQSFATDFFDYLRSLDTDKDDGFNDLHALFGTVCALAELQQALPGFIQTKKPLRLVLDRRPFI
ncbi:MAG: hypothetical protein IJB80_02075 [Clostridia bacterium]|nr:hypothetical protein [Clostridia bacterium]